MHKVSMKREKASKENPNKELKMSLVIMNKKSFY